MTRPAPHPFRPEKRTNVRLKSLVAVLASRFPGLMAMWAAARFFTPPPGPPSVPDLVGARRDVVFLRGRALPLYAWGTGPRVILVHGWGGSAAQLAPLIPPLVAAGHEVVAHDAPGHGGAAGGATTARDMARALEVVAAHVGGASAVVAHSLGAMATAMALEEGLDVERVVLLAPAVDPRRALDRFAGFLGWPSALAPRLHSAVERRAGFPLDEACALRRAPRLRVPMLAVHDEEDAEVPLAEARELTARWPGAELVVTRGLGHRRLLADREVARRVIRFLRGAGRERGGERIPGMDLGLAATS